MGLPLEAYHAGQIIFGPADGYLYFMIGDASHLADPYNFAQNKKSLIGKILRLDIDIIPSKNLPKKWVSAELAISFTTVHCFY